MADSIDSAQTIDVLGPHIRLLSSLQLSDDDFLLIDGTLDPDVVVPLHSHPDRETFLVMDGSLEVFVDDHWRTLSTGDLLDVRNEVRHAWRNTSGALVRLLLVTTVRIGHFFEEIGQPVGTVSMPPSPEVMHKLLAVSERYGYWNATPEENAAIGLILGPG